MIPRSMGRPVPAALVALFAAISISGCQDGQIDTNQVCQFQCDYEFNPPGNPEAAARLTERDVVQVIANAITEANANGITDFAISVNDHLNNVLAVYDSDASTINYSRITSQESPGSDFQQEHSLPVAGPRIADFSGTPSESLETALDGVFIPAGYAAISKAGTANYFSTQGNAFSTRTANTLIQQNFVPGETDRPGGPLFAVQIAQLVCSDINTRQGVQVIGPDSSNATGSSPFAGATDLLGPRRLPVGFAADPGGLPLYKDGIPELEEDGITTTGRFGKVVVGSVGIEYNGIYSLDRDATNKDRNIEERIAVAATRGFEADPERRANRITVAGRALRFFDDGGTRSRSSDVPVIAPDDVGNEAAILALLQGINGGVAGDFVNDSLYFPFDEPRQGVFFLSAESGIVAETFLAADAGLTPAELDNAEGEKLVDSFGNDRYPAIDSSNPATGAGGLTSEEVQELLINALLLAENTRAQTRTPLGGPARIDVAVVDLDGNVLGFARSQDALIDGVDVTIAKTRQAAFWSKDNARTQIENAVDPLGNAGLLNAKNFDDYITDTADFLGSDPSEIFDGSVAWSSIALGGIANPDFPPGILDADEGPLSRNDREWSIFSTGIQTEIVLPGIALGLCEEVPDLAFVLDQLGLTGLSPTRTLAVDGSPQNDAFCQAVRTALIGSPDPAQQETCIQGVQDGGAGLITGLQNGFHIFQGAVPIYRGNQLVGAYGVSGDGAEQDDFVPFVGLDIVNKNQTRRGEPAPIGNAPKSIRADRISVQDINLRYVVCPPAPFLSSNEQNGCSGR